MVRLGKFLVALLCLLALWRGGWEIYVRKEVADWFADRAASGWQAEYGEMTSGFDPLVQSTRLSDPVLADPTTGVAWQADWLVLENPMQDPGAQTLRFASTPQRISHLDRTWMLSATDMTAALSVDILDQLQLSESHIRAGAWALERDGMPGLAADDFDLTLTQQAAPQSYRITGEAANVHAITGIDAPAVTAGGTIRLDGTVDFSRRWDASALTEGRPQPRRIRLTYAEAEWGGLQLSLTARLDMDDAGMPTGEVSLKAKNWRDVLDAAHEAGNVSGTLAATLRGTLALLQRFGGSTSDLDVTITFADGAMSAGLIPLGAAPLIVLR